jgi:hypothetical protein
MGGMTSDELDVLVRKAQSVGDQEGVQAALVALSVVDPVRAARLLDELEIGLDLDIGTRADTEG